MFAYGSYLERGTSIGRTSFAIAIIDTLVALMAGMAIFPIVFAHGLEPGAGPGLVFVTLPIAFGKMPAGQIIGLLFFVMLVVAAWTSSISMLEAIVEDDETLTATVAKVGGDRLRILVAEDNHVNQKVIFALLKPLNCQVDVVANGLEAVQQVQYSHYDVVLMDIQMPEMDGPTATQRIRAQGGFYERLPIIALTAHAMQGDEEKARAAGCDDYLTKPIDEDQLFAMLEKYLN